MIDSVDCQRFSTLIHVNTTTMLIPSPTTSKYSAACHIYWFIHQQDYWPQKHWPNWSEISTSQSIMYLHKIIKLLLALPPGNGYHKLNWDKVATKLPDLTQQHILAEWSFLRVTATFQPTATMSMLKQFHFKWATRITKQPVDDLYGLDPTYLTKSVHSAYLNTWNVQRGSTTTSKMIEHSQLNNAHSQTGFSDVIFFMRHLVSTICSSHRNAHRN